MFNKLFKVFAIIFLIVCTYNIFTNFSSLNLIIFIFSILLNLYASNYFKNFNYFYITVYFANIILSSNIIIKGLSYEDISYKVLFVFLGISIFIVTILYFIKFIKKIKNKS